MKTSGLRRSFSRVFSSTIGVLLFFSCTPFVFAETIRQPIDTSSYTIENDGGISYDLTLKFIAPTTGFVYSYGFELEGLVTDLYISSANTGVCLGNGTGCVYPNNLPQQLLDKAYYVFDMSSAPFPIVKGVEYEIYFQPRSLNAHGLGVVIGHSFGVSATSTVYVGVSGTTTAYEAGGNPVGMAQPTFFIATSPLDFTISNRYPAATSTALDLPTAQAFCGSATFATSTGFWDATGQAFGRGMCLALAYLFVPNSDSISQWVSLNDTIQTKIPFSYVYGVKDIYSALSASTTANLLAVTFNLPAVGSTSPIGTLYPTTIVGLSTSTIGTYLNENFRQGMLGMQRVFLWATLAYMFYRRIIPHHVMHTTV